MQIHTILRRSVAGTCALALTTVGFVALPGVASAAPNCTEVTVPSDTFDLGARTPGDVLCLDYTAPMDGFVALGATDTGRPEGDQDVFADWSAPASTLVWTVPQPRNGISPEIDIDTNDAGTFVTTYSWEEAPIDPGPSEPPVVTTPTPPSTISAVATDTTLALTWSGGAGGDAGFDHYTVAWYLGGEEVDRTTTLTEGITLENLLADTTYEVRVWTVDTNQFESADYISLVQATGTTPVPDPSSSSPAPDPSPSDPGPLPAVDPVADGPLDAVAGVESTFDVLANDPEGTTGAAISTAPQHGTASFDEQGRLHYTPSIEFAGEDSLSYAVAGSEVPAVVTIVVAAYVPLGAPTEFVTTDVRPTQMSVSWGAPAGASTSLLQHYIVVWYDGADAVYSDPTTETTWTFDGLTPSTVYQWRVYAVDALDVRGTSDAWMEVSTAAPEAPHAVTNLSAVKYHDGGDYTDLTWDAAQQGTYGPLAYVVEYRQSPEGDWTLLTVTDGLQATFDGTHTQAWDFRVYAVDRDRLGGEADLVTSPADELVLPDYADFHGFTDVGTDHVDFAWGDEGAGTFPIAGFHVQYRVRGVGEWISFDSPTGSYTLDGLSAATEYEFLLNAFDTQGNVGPGSWTAVTTDALPVPVADEYDVYTQRTWFLDVLSNDPGSPTSATVVDGPGAGEVSWDGTRFQYHVTEPGTYEDSFTYRNDLTDEITTVTLTIHDPVAWVMGGITVEATGSTTIHVTWDEPDPGTFDLYGYYVYYSDGGRYVHSGRVLGTETDLEGLTPGTEYEIYVMSSDGTNLSRSSHEFATTDEPAAPTVPTGLVAETAGSDAVDLSWNASEPGDNELDGYDVLYRVAGDEQWQYFDYAYDTSITVDGLDAATEYEFAVDACDVQEYCSELSTTAFATTDDAPAAPLHPQVSTPDAILTGGTATFAITDVSDAAIVEAGDLGDGVADVAVDGLTVTVTTVHGFSGTLVQTLLVSDGGDPVEVEATVTVNPDPAARPTYKIVTATASRVLWAAGAGATGYVVKVGGTTVCTTTQLNCLLPRLLGPASVVTVLATGNDGTVSIVARATWVSVPVNFGHVHFVGDSPVLTDASATQLRTLSAKLMAAGVTRLTVHGYTATLGTDTRTPIQLRLSGMRANAVAAYITAFYTAHGKTVRIVRVAEGATHPIASNATYAGRAENRRAEVVLG